VDRTRVPFERVLDNVARCARTRTTTIQSLFARHHDEPPGAPELDAWAERLMHIVATGGRVGWIQVHTVSRPPAESYVAALTPIELEEIADRARRAVPTARVEVFRGAS
jgi:hypothetical protein